MKLKYLGTAAAEGFPAIFCNCKNCSEARRLGGKNIRTRSQSLINSDLLIDFPADTYHHFITNGIEGDRIRYLIITHDHADHYYRRDLQRKRTPYAHNMREESLKLLCPKDVADDLGDTAKNVEITVAKEFETVKFGDYEITPFPARHSPGKDAFIYLIKADKTILYAHDTGYFKESIFTYLEENKITLDMISLDCTNVNIPIEDKSGHMGFPNIERVLAKLKEIGAVTDKCIKYVNHFSHNGNPLHEHLESEAKKYGLSVSYDGCVVDI